MVAGKKLHWKTANLKGNDSNCFKLSETGNWTFIKIYQFYVISYFILKVWSWDVGDHRLNKKKIFGLFKTPFWREKKFICSYLLKIFTTSNFRTGQFLRPDSGWTVFMTLLVRTEYHFMVHPNVMKALVFRWFGMTNFVILQMFHVICVCSGLVVSHRKDLYTLL